MNLRSAFLAMTACALLPTTLGVSAPAGWIRYTDPKLGWTIDHPPDVMISSVPVYVEVLSGSDSTGDKMDIVSFVVPLRLWNGTNLHNDTTLSVISGQSACAPSQSSDPSTQIQTLKADGRTYTVLIAQDAGAGNRYETREYFIHDTSPCIAVRYFIHSSAIENYDPGTVKAFDEKTLLALFDRIRATLRLTK